MLVKSLLSVKLSSIERSEGSNNIIQYQSQDSALMPMLQLIGYRLSITCGYTLLHMLATQTTRQPSLSYKPCRYV